MNKKVLRTLVEQATYGAYMNAKQRHKDYKAYFLEDEGEKLLESVKELDSLWDETFPDNLTVAQLEDIADRLDAAHSRYCSRVCEPSLDEHAANRGLSYDVLQHLSCSVEVVRTFTNRHDARSYAKELNDDTAMMSRFSIRKHEEDKND